MTVEEQIQGHHTPESLNIEDGDIIDVRVSQRHTNGACPLPPQQTLPNIHYLAPVKPEPGTPDADDDVRAVQQQQREAPRRVKIVIQDLNGFTLESTLKVGTPFEGMMKEYARRKQLAVEDCKFVFDGVRVLTTQTPQEVGVSRPFAAQQRNILTVCV